MNNFFLLILMFSTTLCSLKNKEKNVVKDEDYFIEIFDKNPVYVSNGFDFPVGKPDASGYSDAQPFTMNNHLGEDWIKAGRKEMGVPIYASSNGIVSFADDIAGGWGSIVRIIHITPSKILYETVYAHLQKIRVNVGDKVKKGDIIGTMGDANGVYWVHLHFEIRNKINLPIGPGYSSNTDGYLDPKKFINKNRFFK
ncbi:MAG: M23 family metallopeptidase [Leptospiraceae bacterium]|nr:M23 family metallopeptidase [Leptospiraceae bacterium]